jgi:1-deoxy-D-xylulose-5-phosphate synthase
MTSTSVDALRASSADDGVLSALTGPDDLRRLDAADLATLADELRAELVRRVTVTGGHLGPSLGVVELTIALHRVFDSPRDPIVWDTGHQAYVHKMLTGRLGRFDRLRRRGGLSGYPSRAESEHDLVENSHASTGLSYADGLARGFALAGRRDRTVVAVVGDGALTGGMSWEAMNNLGATRHPAVVVLNDNGRSYAPTAGRLAAHLSSLRAGEARDNLFEALGFVYVGPVDGHDVEQLQCALRAAAMLRRPVVVHAITRKGAGHPPAELDDVDRQHSVSGLQESSQVPTGPGWTATFGDELLTLGAERPDLVAVTAAMLEPTGLARFAEAFPERVVDVGIAEQHAVASAAGLAAAGLHPVVAIYSTFLNRAFDQVLLDVGLHRAPVTFVLDRAGITGPDGPSHHGMWDLALFGLVPRCRVAAPRDPEQLRALLRECVGYDGPSMIRFPRGRSGLPIPAQQRWGTADVLAPGEESVLLVAVGPLAGAALAARECLVDHGIDAAVVDPRWLQPLDDALVAGAARHRLIVTVEDNAPSGGFGEALSRALREHGCSSSVRTLALPSREFVPMGSREELLAEHGLDAAGIVRAVLDGA